MNKRKTMTDKNLYDINGTKIGYYRKLKDGTPYNLYEVYYDDSEDKGDYLQSDEFENLEECAEEEAYDYARSVLD
jgi:hypothetical protein